LDLIGKRKNEMMESVACVGERRGEERRDTYIVLVGKPEMKRLLRRLKRRLENNIKMDLQEMGSQAWNGSIWLRKGTCCGFLKRRR
jgi:hypothetical protein